MTAMIGKVKAKVPASPVKTPAKPRPRAKPARFVQMVEPFEGGSALIKITMGEGAAAKSFYYWLDKLPTDFGRGFVLTKYAMPADGDEGEDRVYRVCVENEQDGYCECKGFSRWGACKHVGAVRALISRGKV